MANKTIMIVAAIAAVVVISSSAFVLMNNSNGNEYENLKMISLSVYGNANEDYTIDQKDVDLINEMISNGTDLSEHPYADANRDGSVTSEDVEIVNKIIKGETTTISLVDQYVYTAGIDHVATIIYPLRNVIAINPDMIQLTFFFDGDKYVAGYIANSEAYPVTFHKILTNGVSKSMGSTPRQMAAGEWQAVKNLDAELYTKGESIGAILAYNDGAFTDYKDDVISAGIPIIYLRTRTPTSSRFSISFTTVSRLLATSKQ